MNSEEPQYAAANIKMALVEIADDMLHCCDRIHAITCGCPEVYTPAGGLLLRLNTHLSFAAIAILHMKTDGLPYYVDKLDALSVAVFEVRSAFANIREISKTLGLAAALLSVAVQLALREILVEPQCIESLASLVKSAAAVSKAVRDPD